ncbi:hypothetical protein HELRODRAFT_166402 [Helobdella robusta]|uniref:Uncharacterized protein n=1 Tax=Helobdella robusta TaxID=6412 RepID=T1EY33_HELRO|nr:hypothetical protein HELRODRAFT_166402 [Helobdella robusta]ESN90698.1 hypothetical protein HELRODRAFT_166402 [Helobdella robusta]
MESDLSTQSEQLLQRIFCDKLSESDRNLLQNWLTSKLTIERCGWKKKVQDSLKMVDQERNTNLEAHSFISRLHEEMKTFLTDNDLIEKYKSENGYLGSLEEIPNLRSFRLKAIYKMWKTISQTVSHQRIKSRNSNNSTSKENQDEPENVTDVTISIEGPDGKITQKPATPNIATDANKSNNNRYGRRSTICDSANMSLQLKIEKLKNENKQLKNYIENVSKNYQNLFFKYSQVVGEANKNNDEQAVTSAKPAKSSGNVEPVKSRQKQFATRRKEAFPKSLDIPSSGRELKNLVLERNFTISEVEKTGSVERCSRKILKERKLSERIEVKRMVHQQSEESSRSSSSRGNENKNETLNAPKNRPKYQQTNFDLSSESENDGLERRNRCLNHGCICSISDNMKQFERNNTKQSGQMIQESKNIKDFLKITSTSKPILPKDVGLFGTTRELTQNLMTKSKSKIIDSKGNETKNDKIKTKKRVKNKKEKVKNK